MSHLMNAITLFPPAPSLETNTEVTKTAIHRLAARGWLQKGVSPIGPVYTWSLHAFSLNGYLSDLLKCFHLHLAT